MFSPLEDTLGVPLSTPRKFRPIPIRFSRVLLRTNKQTDSIRLYIYIYIYIHIYILSYCKLFHVSCAS
jgi:hypothetical protein